MIKGVQEGNYSLYAWVPGFIGDYKYDSFVNIIAGLVELLIPFTKTKLAQLYCFVSKSIARFNNYCILVDSSELNFNSNVLVT